MPLNARNFTNFTFPINILSYFFLQLLMSLTRCIGQGNFNSKFNHDGTSIVKRLASRSLTGRGLQIHIHQHIGYRLHLVWHTICNGEETSRCIERVFLLYEDVSDFCENLMSKAFEGMCDCVCIHVSEWLKEEVKLCQVPIRTESLLQRKVRYCPRSWLRTLQETEKYGRYRCTCRVTSSHAVF